MDAIFHTPIMVQEVVDCLRCRSDGTYVDGTVGGGGHAFEILKQTGPAGLVIGIDKDDDALSAAQRRLAPFGERVILERGSFADIGRILRDLHIDEVDGILLDLGVSSHQLDTVARGFSFSGEAPLDMRMDRDGGLTAADIVNRTPERELKRILREYGEETGAGRIARAIVKRRERSPITTTTELAALIAGKGRSTPGRRRIHPATKTFQALRIAVNDELADLHAGLDEGIDLLRKGGRFTVISFHSLEDRIVKERFRSWEKGCICPPGMPICTCGRTPKLRILTRKPLTPGEREIEENPRSRSAKLRAAERV